MAKHASKRQARRLEREQAAELKKEVAAEALDESLDEEKETLDEQGVLEPEHTVGEDYEHEAPSVEEMIDVAEWLPNDGTQNNAYPAGVTQIDYKRKSKKTRVGLVVVIVLLVALIAGLGYVGVHLVEQANTEAEDALNAALKSGNTGEDNILLTQEDVDKHTKALASVPDLAHMIGKTPDTIIMTLGSSAQVTAKPLEDEKADDKDKKDKDAEKASTSKAMRYTIMLANGASATATRSLYLITNEAGLIIDAGYATSLADLSYGEASFKDVVEAERAVDAVLIAAGIAIDEGAIALPADETKYRETKGGDLMRESYTFTGVASNDEKMEYTCRLTYDYSTANASDNLDETVKQLYISVHKD